MSWWNFFSKPKAKGVQTYCVPNSILCAWTCGAMKHDPVRIAVTKVDPVKDIDHAQAQAKVDGAWTPLTERWTGQHIEIVPWQRHYPQEPYRYLTLREWIDEQIKFAEGQ